MAVGEFMFGSGLLTGLRNDVSGVQTPRRFGTLQDVSIEFNGEIKELFGQYQFPVDTARGKTKIQGKAKLASIDVNAYNDLFFGQTIATAATDKYTFNEARTGAATVVATVSGTPWIDEGVFYATTGGQLERIDAGSEGTGLYSFDETNGTYVFAGSDIGAAVLLNYISTVSTGHNLAISGTKFMGNTPRFQITLFHQFENNQLVFQLLSCVSTRLTYPTRIDDYVIQDMDFSAFSNAAGNIGSLNVSV